jgi:hypothetical protein
VRLDFLNELLGYSALDGDNNIMRTLPDLHPEITNFFANDATVDGVGPVGQSDAGSVSFTLAKVTTNYKPRPYDLLTDDEVSGFDVTGDNPEFHRYLTRKYSFNIDYLSVNGSMMFVTATGSPSTKRTIPNPPGKAVGTMGLQYVWTEVPAITSNQFSPPNLTAVKSCLGKVNSEVFDAGGFNAPAGTILFVGIDPQMVMPKLNGDTFYWEITFSFLFRDNGYNSTYSEEQGHNYLFRPELGWDLVTVDGTSGGDKIYQTTNLNTLLKIG